MISSDSRCDSAQYAEYGNEESPRRKLRGLFFLNADFRLLSLHHRQSWEPRIDDLVWRAAADHLWPIVLDHPFDIVALFGSALKDDGGAFLYHVLRALVQGEQGIAAIRDVNMEKIEMLGILDPFQEIRFLRRLQLDVFAETVLIYIRLRLSHGRMLERVGVPQIIGDNLAGWLIRILLRKIVEGHRHCNRRISEEDAMLDDGLGLELHDEVIECPADIVFRIRRLDVRWVFIHSNHNTTFAAICYTMPMIIPSSTSALRFKLKNNSIIRNSYYHALLYRNAVKSWFDRMSLKRNHPVEYGMLKEMRAEARKIFPLDLKLENHFKYYNGKNLLGYPAMGYLMKDGKNIGWEEGRVTAGDTSVQLMQLSVDREVNFPNLFKKYRPEVILDFGTASGGTIAFYHNLASEYCNPKILSIDITDADYNLAKDFHEKNKTAEKAKLILGKSTLDCFDEVKEFLKQRQPGQRVLLSLDDDHEFDHTYKELEMYAPLLEKGDVILMQDTWNQDLYGQEVSPMLSVYKFLKNHSDFELDADFNRSLELPCNFIYGVIVKK